MASTVSTSPAQVRGGAAGTLHTTDTTIRERSRLLLKRGKHRRAQHLQRQAAQVQRSAVELLE